MSTLAKLIEDDPWLEYGLTVFTTNVVCLDTYRVWTKEHAHISTFGRVVRSTMSESLLRKEQCRARALARKLAQVEELRVREREQRARRRRETLH
ncbi:MAG TPA: hypothetical protein VHC69_31670 [Polyangiaceae bacterium]|nr:hypothetical protein [Polyangiaceae bacterium]